MWTCYCTCTYVFGCDVYITHVRLSYTKLMLFSFLQLFYLVANSYQTQCKTVEMLRQRGRDICWTFIMDHSPLQLKLDDSVRQRICKPNPLPWNVYSTSVHVYIIVDALKVHIHVHLCILCIHECIQIVP